MQINTLELIDGAKRAAGYTVIIDVFRAMTVEAYIIAQGARDLIPMGDIDAAYAYRDAHPGTILIGERKGRKCPGFDFGNSPSAIRGFDFTGKTVVHTTSAGTQGIANATGASAILTGALVNARATASYLLNQHAHDISLVCMGLAGRESTREDLLCAQYLESLLQGSPISLAEGIRECRATSGAKFFDPTLQEVFPEEDFWLCVEADRFDFALAVRRGADGLMHTLKISEG